ncbi:MAG: cytochrome c-type biogenesis protein CcmH [Pseudomonadota bacterium]|nr:cytochrome c-type biogenesis protein CcmH [Pseudomonadota bacterium]
MRRLAQALLAVLSLAAAPATLPDPAQEQRARALFREIRCVVCQNESIDASPADIAGDLRAVVREQVAAGRSDAEIRAFLVERYGEFVLFRPAFSPGNALLWLTPFAVVLLGLGAFAARSGRRPGSPADAALEPWSASDLGTEPDERNVT